MKEYVGCNINRNWYERWVKLTQQVMVQIFQDEFELYAHGKDPTTPSKPSKVISEVENKSTLSKGDQNT